jgi:XTP/dITP diphosphohydrolase
MLIWFATGNLHKKTEISAILTGHTIKIPADAGIDFDPDETGKTFLDNALIKARELQRLLAERNIFDPVLADESGLCVDALDGRPGIFSARYGSEGDPSKRNALLLCELGDNPRREARFVCSMVLLYNNDRFFTAQETLEGELIREERGGGGFGYDPIFYVPSLGRTVAELPEVEKNRISHRGKAGKAIAALLTGI